MSEQDGKEFIERFTVRMPMGMRERVAERAERNGRSMNSEIVQILQDALDCKALPNVQIDDELNGLNDIISTVISNKNLLSEQVENNKNLIEERNKIINQLADMQRYINVQKQLQKEIIEQQNTIKMQNEQLASIKNAINEQLKNSK
ncbi:Arc family DNA-binding protein [Providencia stuartii]